MPNGLVVLAWAVLAMVHVMPAVAAVAPGLLGRLYGIDPDGLAGLLLRHRAMLFAAVLAACLLAMADPGARRAAGLVAAISMAGFLWLYLRAGQPPALRSIAIADLVALPALAVVLWAGWIGARPVG